MAPALHPEHDATTRRAALLTLLLACAGCGDALSFYAPPQKEPATLLLFPPERAVGSAQTRVIALISRPDTQSAEILEFNFGDGVVVTEFSTGGGAGCQWIEVQDALTTYQQTRDDAFPICFELDLRPNATPGLRTVSLDLSMDSSPVIARAPFSLLPASP